MFDVVGKKHELSALVLNRGKYDEVFLTKCASAFIRGRDVFKNMSNI